MQTILRAVGGALAGSGAWFSLGVLAHAPGSGGASSIGLLPPVWVGALLCIAGVIAAVRITSLSLALLLLPALSILPWVGPQWPPLLLWTGPCVLVIWALVGVGTLRVVHWPRASDRAHMAIAAAATVTCVSLFAWSTAPAGITGDEPHYLLIANSVSLDGDVDLANDYEPSRHRAFYAGALEPHTILTAAGKEYSFHGPGVAFLVLPGFAAAGLSGARIVVMAVTTLGMLALWNAIRALTPSTPAAWIGILALLLQLPFLAQSTAIYPDGPGAAITSIALWTLARLETGRPVSTARLTWTGAALSALPWLHIRLALLAIIFGTALAVAAWRREKTLTPLLSLFSVPVVSGFAFFVSSLIMFDTLDATAPFRQKAAASPSGAPSGALGLLVDHEYGLLVYAPVMILAIGGVIPCVRRAWVTAWSSVAAVVGTWLMAATFVWWAGTSAPARFLVPVLPAMALWLALGWPAWNATLRNACVAAIAIGGVITALAAWADRGLYVTTSPDGRFTVFDWASALLNLPDALPSWFRPGSSLAENALIAGVGLVTGAALVWGARRIIATRAASSDPWPVIAWCAVAWVSIAVSAGWMMRGLDPRTPDRAQLALLQASTRPWLRTGWRQRTPMVAREDVLRRLAFAARAEDNPLTLLHVPRVPAGRYQIEVLDAGASAANVSLALEVGRDAWPLQTWPLAAPDRAPGLTMIMGVHSVRVTTTATVDPAVTVRLKVLGGMVAGPLLAEVAERVTRYGSLLVYSLDRASMMQTGEFWFSGDRRGRVVIARDDGSSPSLALTIEAGVAPVEIVLRQGDWQNDLSLAPGAREGVALPASDRPTPLSIEVRGGDRRGPAVSISVQERATGS